MAGFQVARRYIGLITQHPNCFLYLLDIFQTDAGRAIEHIGNRSVGHSRVFCDIFDRYQSGFLPSNSVLDIIL